MTGGFNSLLALPEQDRRDVFEAAASRLDPLPGYVEKDFWVCLVLDALFSRLPKGHPSPSTCWLGNFPGCRAGRVTLCLAPVPVLP